MRIDTTARSRVVRWTRPASPPSRSSRDLPADELATIASLAGESEIPVGASLAVEGDFGHSVFAIESGAADVVAGGETIGAIGPGDVVGEIAVLASGRRTASIVATTPMRVISLFKRDVWTLEKNAPEASRRLRELIDQHHAAPGAP